MSKKPKLPRFLKRKKNRAKSATPEQEIVAGVPRITTETIAEHREEVLSSARKYIYPLQHSKHRIVLISTGLFIVTVVAFFTYCTVALYRIQSTSTFLYRVTQVIPFPVARTGGEFVSYENYLFELRHYMHYYSTQQKLNFNDKDGKAQLAEFKKRALEKIVNDAYIKQLAKKHDVTVSNKEIDDQIAVVRQQNRLGGSEQVLEDVLKDYWGWSLDDFKRSLREQLLAQKVVAVMDKDTQARAEGVLNELKNGADFATLAKTHSDDASTKDGGGEFGIQIDRANRDLSARTTSALFALQPGQTSEIVNIGYALEVVKNIETNGDKVKGAHILFNFADVNTYINDLKEHQKARLYINP